MNQHTSLWHYFLAIIVSILWGANFAFAKAAVIHFPPYTLLTLRFALVALILLPFFPKPPPMLKHIALIAFTNVVLHLGCMFWSLRLGLDASLGVVTEMISIPFLLLLSVFFFQEKIGWRSIMGVAVAFIGIFILMETPNSIEHPFAFFLMIISGFFWAVYSVFLKQAKDINPMALIAWMSLFAVPMNIPFAVLFESNHVEVIQSATMLPIFSLLFIAIGSTIMAHGLWTYLLSKNPVQAIAPVILLIPLFGVVAAVLLLDETLSDMMIIGSILMVAGVGIVTIRRPRMIEKDAEIG